MKFLAKVTYKYQPYYGESTDDNEQYFAVNAESLEEAETKIYNHYYSMSNPDGGEEYSVRNIEFFTEL